jgi:hypothetical protein
VGTEWGARAGEGRPGLGGKWELNGERELWRAGRLMQHTKKKCIIGRENCFKNISEVTFCQRER